MTFYWRGTILALAGWLSGPVLATPPAVILPSEMACAWDMRQMASESLDEQLARLKDSVEVTEMRLFDTVRLQGPQACRLGGIGPCVGIAIVNKRTKVAYLGHFGAQTPGEFVPFIDGALREASSPGDLQVVMVGGQIAQHPSSFRFHDYQEDAVAYAASLRGKLAAAGIPPGQITDRLRVEPTAVMYDLLVDTRNRRIYVGKLPHGTLTYGVDGR